MWKGLGEDQKVVVVVPPRGALRHESGLHIADFDEIGCYERIILRRISATVSQNQRSDHISKFKRFYVFST